jgi:hypothetical protein
MATSANGIPQRIIQRPMSRSSSRTSIRAPSPAQNSSQGQTPRRPASHLPSPTTPQFAPVQASTPTSAAAKRRSSYDVLSSLAASGRGPESLLPLPVLRNTPADEIREGIPADFSTTRPQSPNNISRSFSPTRTMSREINCVLQRSI